MYVEIETQFVVDLVLVHFRARGIQISVHIARDIAICDMTAQIM